LICPAVSRQYTNVTDRQDRQRSDSTDRTVLQTVHPKDLSTQHFGVVIQVSLVRQWLKRVSCQSAPEYTWPITQSPQHSAGRERRGHGPPPTALLLSIDMYSLPSPRINRPSRQRQHDRWKRFTAANYRPASNEH